MRPPHRFKRSNSTEMMVSPSLRQLPPDVVAYLREWASLLEGGNHYVLYKHPTVGELYVVCIFSEPYWHKGYFGLAVDPRTNDLWEVTIRGADHPILPTLLKKPHRRAVDVSQWTALISALSSIPTGGGQWTPCLALLTAEGGDQVCMITSSGIPTEGQGYQVPTYLPLHCRDDAFEYPVVYDCVEYPPGTYGSRFLVPRTVIEMFDALELALIRLSQIRLDTHRHLTEMQKRLAGERQREQEAAEQAVLRPDYVLAGAAEDVEPLRMDLSRQLNHTMLMPYWARIAVMEKPDNRVEVSFAYRGSAINAEIREILVERYTTLGWTEVTFVDPTPENHHITAVRLYHPVIDPYLR